MGFGVLAAGHTHAAPRAGTVTVWVTNYSDQAGPTHWGGWSHPAPGPDVVACSDDLAPLSVVWIAGHRFVCWDTMGPQGAAGKWLNGQHYSWIDTSIDYGLDGFQDAIITGEIEGD